MHAVIKIISFLVFGAAVSTGNKQVLLAGTLLVIPLYFLSEQVHFAGAFAMLRRLKWLFVSILIVYLFFTPGQLLFPGVLWGPTIEGFLQGVIRIAALTLLVAAVNLLIKGTEQDEFLSAIIWCLYPLSVFGISHEKLAIRITLTLDAVSQSRGEFIRETATGRTEHGSNRLGAISLTASQLFERAISDAGSAPLREITLPEETRPPMLQWLIPFGLVLLFILIHNFNVIGPV